MPPKLRRPASARGRALRRPAAVEPEREEEIERKLSSGGPVVACKVTLEEALKCKRLRVKGTYWQEEVEFVGRVLSPAVDGRELYLQLQLEGSPAESVISWATGHPGVPCRLHLCREDCNRELSEDGLFHAVTLEDLGVEGAILPPWENNLLGEDENAKLRQRAEAAKAKSPNREKDKKRKRTSSSSPSSGRKKASKEKKRKKKERKERQKVQGQKELKDLYGKTGLDPDPEVRRELMRKAKKVIRKKKNRSSSRGSSTSSSGGQSSGEELFQEEMKVKAVSEKIPGVLAANAIREMQGKLLSHTGQIWERDVSKLPPLLTAHYRQHLQGKMTAAMAREVRTLCYACDLLLLGRPASALDTLVQRVKALELQATGSHFSIAQRLELLPREEEVLAGRMEAKEAAREAREDYKARLGTQRVPFDPKGKGDPKGGKGKDNKGKGDGKDDSHRLKEKGGKGDAKKEKGS